jgi:polar amino acid transport system substrate-binding protein
MLLAGRIDAFPQEINVGYFNLKQLLHTESVDRITHHPRHISVNQSYLLLPRSLPNSEALLDSFNAWLATFKESGRYDAYFSAFENGDYALDARSNSSVTTR